VKFNNEKGMSLVEVLVVLVLISLVATLIWTATSVAFRYNIVETKKMKMQQDANYIISSILQKHRTVNDCYELDIVEDGRKLVYSECNDELEQDVILGTVFKYELIDVGKEPEESISLPIEIYPKIEDLQTILKVSDPENNKLFVSVNTIFKRYKSNKEDEIEGEG